LAQVGDGHAERDKHCVALFGMDEAGGQSGGNHSEGLLDGVGIAEGVEYVRAEAGAGAEDGRSGAAEFLVMMAEGAGGYRGRLAEATIGFGMAAELVVGVSRVHWCSFPGLNGKGRKLTACGLFFVSTA
jgi:hypothetical protein